MSNIVAMVKDSTDFVLTLKPEAIHSLFPLLRHGVMVNVPIGCSIRTVLIEYFRLHPEYVENRIKTVLLNGNPVDDIDSVIISDGSTLALSAAMPGLAGAILRRSSPLATLRSQIINSTESETDSHLRGMIVLKIFNLLINEIGPAVLQRGVYVRGEDLENHFVRLPEEFWQGCTAATLGGQNVGIEPLLRMEWLGDHHLVLLRVRCEG